MNYLNAVKVLKARKLTVIAVAVIAFGLLMVAPKPKPPEIIPIYTSKSKVLITPPSSSVRAYGGNSGFSADFSWFSDPTVLTELLRSEEFLGRVIQATNVDVSQQALAYSITVEPLSQGRGVRLFNLKVNNRDPKGAQKLTRLLTDEFVRYVEELSGREFASTRRFIEELVLEAEGRRDASEFALLEVREKYLGGESDDTLLGRVRTLEGRMNETQRSASSLQAEVNALGDFREGRTTSPPWQILSGSNGTLGTLESNVTEKKLELTRVSDIYVDTNEIVVAARRALSKAEALYDEALNETVDSLYKTKSSELQQNLSERSSMGSEINGLLRSRMSDDDRRRITKLERELQVWEQNHLNLQQQLYQARVVEQSSRRQGAVNVLEQPGVGTVAYDPNAKRPVITDTSLKRNLMAIPFCVLLGITAAFVQEYLAGSTKLRPKIEEALELPILAVIPSTPSELTVNWESFKRPGNESLQPLVLASHRGSGFENRKSKTEKIGEKIEAPVLKASTKPKEDSVSGGFGDNFRFRNQK